MKNTGMVRSVDALGRIVLPVEMRRGLGVEERDSMEIYREDDKIILRKHVPSMKCMVTGNYAADNIQLAGGRLVLSEQAAKLILQELQNRVN